MKNFSWKLILVFAVIVAAVIYVLPTLEPSLWPHKQINLGLDLQGGMHLVLEVDTAKAIDGQVERIMQEIRDQLRKERLRGVSLDRIEGNKIAATIQDSQIAEKFIALIKDEFDPLKSTQNVSGGTTTIILQLPTAEAENVEKLAVDQALETIRNRIDQFGVAEPDIRRQGQRRILIQLPGIKDADRAKDLIGRTALLEFKLVDDNQDVSAVENGTVPPGREILYRVETDAESGQVSKIPFLLKKRTLLTGANLTIDSTGFLEVFGNSTLSLSGDLSFAMTDEANWNFASGSTLEMTGGVGASVDDWGAWSSLEIAGIEKPGAMQGASLMPLIRNSGATWREYVGICRGIGMHRQAHLF